MRLDAFGREASGFWWRGRIHFGDDDQQYWRLIEQRVTTATDGLVVRTQIGVDDEEAVELRVGGTLVSATATASQFQLASDAAVEVVPLAGTTAKVVPEQGLLYLSSSDGQAVQWESGYRTTLPVDSLPWLDVQLPPRHPVELPVVPGCEAIQLPLPVAEMPIALAWNPRGEMFIGSLKGRVLQVLDRDGDGWYDDYSAISDNLPTPYGIWAGENHLDVLVKFALLRMKPNPHGNLWDAEVLADGWGYTSDYHDWAVGLERDAQGNYYAALPCQQDDRLPEQAVLRGHAIKLIPDPDAVAGRMYRVESISAGLRFPMGIVLTREGDLFTTDNQGNYNPFNELNHLRPGRRYGFINKLENRDGFSPPYEEPAINLPHPWTRSVNGVCQLIDPQARRPEESRWGRFDGHLIGCEMNGRFLIRMTLQRVGDTYQGAAYRFSRDPVDQEPTFEGPIVCEISPQGDLYVGNLHDSGWGGGSNTGSLVCIRPTGFLPLGIAEVTADPRGFRIEFTRPIDPVLASSEQAYAIRSYRRIATPAYGGDDQDERQETIAAIRVDADGQAVHLALPQWRPGFVYEINIADIGPAGTSLFPDQAHYTLHVVPQ